MPPAMSDAPDPSDVHDSSDVHDPSGEPGHLDRWEALPAAARLLERIRLVALLGLPPLLAAATTALLATPRWLPLALAGAAAAGTAAAWALGGARHRRTRYRLGDDGLHIRRGIWWRGETVVPRTRVQHLDLERGPLERRLGLATLVVHTAGTRQHAVQLGGLDADRARELRDALIDRDAALDDDAL